MTTRKSLTSFSFRTLAFVLALLLTVGGMPTFALDSPSTLNEEPIPPQAEPEMMTPPVEGVYNATMPAVTIPEHEDIKTNETKRVEITTGGQYVYFKFVPEKTAAYIISSSVPQGFSRYDTYGYLYDSNMSQLTANDDGAGNAQFLMTYTLQANTTYYIAARMLDSAVVGSFDVTVQLRDTDGGPIGVDETKNFEITHPGQRYAYSFTPETSGTYILSTSGSMYFYLYDENWNQTGSYGYNTSFSLNLTAGNTYYLGVRFNGSSIGPGTLSLYASSEKVAGDIALSDTKTVEITKIGERQLYKFTPEKTGQYAISSTQSVYYYLYNADKVLQSTTGTSSYYTVNLTAGTTYYLGTCLYGAQTGTYEIDLGFLSSDVMGEISVGETKEIKISHRGQRQLYAFTPERSGQYVLSADTAVQFYIYNNVLSPLNSTGNTASWTVNLTAGTTYYLGTGCYRNGIGSYNFTLDFIAVDVMGEIAVDETKEIEISNRYQRQLFKFTPTITATYRLSADSPVYFYQYNESQGMSSIASSRTTSWLVTLNEGVTYYLGAGFGGTNTGTFTLTLSGPDIEVIESIALDETKSAKITEVMQIKLYSFTPETSGYYYLENKGSYSFRYFYWFDSNMAQLQNTCSSSYTSCSACYLEAGKTYYVGVGYQGNGTGTLTITLKQAAEIKPDETKTVTIDQAGEMKYYVFTPEETAYYTLSYTGDASVFVCVYNNTNWVQNSSTSGNTIRFVRPLTAGVTYVYGVKFSSNSATGSFDISLEAPAVIKADESVTVNITASGERKYFKFTPAKTGYYAFSANGNSSVYLYVYNDALNQMFNRSGSDIHYYYALTAGKTYFIGTYYYSSGNVGSYTISVENPEIFEVNTTKTVNLITYSAQEFYRFIPAETALYALSVYSNSSERLTVYDEELAQVVSRQGNRFSFLQELIAGKVYYISTNHYYSNQTNSYTVSIALPEIIESNETKTVNVTISGEKKYYKFVPTQTTSLLFFCDSDSPVALYLYDSSYRQLYGTNGTNPYIQRVLTAGETYYLQTYYSSASATGSYELTAKEADRNTISVGQTLLATITYPGEIDLFAFTPETTGPYTFRASKADVDENTYGDLYDSNMQQLRHVSYNRSTTAYYFSVTYTLEAGKTYYWGAGCYGNTTGEYKVTLSQTPLAGIFTEGETKTVTVTEPGQGFYYMFTPTETGVYSFYTDNSVSTYSSLYNGMLSSLSYASGNGQNYTVAYRMNAGEPYYLFTRLSSTASTGSYTVSLNRAETFTVGETKTVTPQKNQHTYFEFTPTETGVYRFYTSSDTNTKGYLYSGGLSSSSASNSGTNYTVAYDLTAGTTYYFRTYYQNADYTDAYTVRLEASDTIEEGETKTVHLENPGERAYFTFKPAKTGFYTFHIDGGSESVYTILYANSLSSSRTSLTGNPTTLEYTYTLSAGNTYYIGAWFSDSGKTGDLTVTAAGIESGGTIKVGDTVHVDPDLPSQYWMYEFVPDVTDTYTLYTTGANGSAIKVHDVNMNVLASATHGEDAAASATLTAGKTYYFLVRREGSAQPFEATLSGTELAGPIEEGTTDVAIDKPYRKLLYTFTPEATGAYTFYVASAVQTYGCLYNSNMESLTKKNGTAYTVTYVLHADTTYYFGTWCDGAETAEYTVKVTGSTPIQPGETLEGELAVESQRDFFWFTPSVSGLYSVNVEADVSVYGCIHSITQDVNQNSTSYYSQRDRSKAIGKRFQMTCRLEAGTMYFISVRGENATNVGSYTIKFIHENEIIVPGEEKTVVDDVTYERSYFTFIPEENGFYTITVTGATSSTSGYLCSGNLRQDYFYYYSVVSNSGTNFAMRYSYYLNANREYYIVTYSNNSETNSYKVTLLKDEEPGELTVGQTETIDVTTPGQAYLYAFTPEESGGYNVYLSNGAVGYWYTSSLSSMNNWNGNATNLTAGQTYYFRSYFNNLSEGTYELTLKKHEPIAVGETKTVELSANETSYFTFTPSETDAYTFFAQSESSTYINCYTSSYSHNAGHSSINPGITVVLNAGTTYYFSVQSNTATTCDVTLERFCIGHLNPYRNYDRTSPAGLPIYVRNAGTQVLFNSGRTGAPVNYGSFNNVLYNYNDATLNNNGYDLYARYNKLNDTNRMIRLGQSFFIERKITEDGVITISSYDVDEESGERDLIYLVDETDGSVILLKKEGTNPIEFIGGAHESWSTNRFVIDKKDLEVGHTYHLEMAVTVESWVIWIRNVEVEFVTALYPFPIADMSFSASIDSTGKVSTDLDITLVGNEVAIYDIEYNAVHSGVNYGQLDVQDVTIETFASLNHEFGLIENAPRGAYTVTAYIRDQQGNLVTSIAYQCAYGYFVVNYNANGGNQNMVPVDGNHYENGALVTVLFNKIPTKASTDEFGYTFIGWAKTPNASTPDYPYTADSEATQTFSITADTVLYAVYRGHTHVAGEWVTLKEVTCVENGMKARYCVTCHKLMAEMEIPAPGHDYDEENINVIAEPAVGVPGKGIVVCKRCGHEKVVTRPPLPSPVEPETEPPVETDIPVDPDPDPDQPVVPDPGHLCIFHFQVVIIDPTCTEWGRVELRCKVCGRVVIDAMIPPLGHKWSTSIKKHPSCNEYGIIEYECVRCDETVEEHIDVNGQHDWHTIEYVEPTCERDGKITKICRICRKEITEVIPKSHVWMSDIVISVSSCTHEGEIRRTCSECGETVIVQTPKTAHRFDKDTHKCVYCKKPHTDYVNHDEDSHKSGMYFRVDESVSGYGYKPVNESGFTLEYNESASLSKVGIFLVQDGTGWKWCIAGVGENIEYLSCVPYVGKDGEIVYSGLNNQWISILPMTENEDKVWSFGDYTAISTDFSDMNSVVEAMPVMFRMRSAEPETGIGIYGIHSMGANTRVFTDMDEMIEWLTEDNVESAITDVTMDIGRSLEVEYHASLNKNHAAAQMRFTYHGETFLVDGVYDEALKTYVYTFDRISPQCMKDNVKAELILVNEDGTETVLSVKEAFSVRSYCDLLLEENPDDAELTALIADLLAYGAAAQEYANYKTDDPANEDLNPTVGEWIPLTETDMSISKTINAGYRIMSAGVHFDSSVSIFYKLRVPNMDGVALTVNGITYTAEDFALVEGTADTYVIYDVALMATDYNKVFTAVLTLNGETIQTLTYSVKSYVYSKQNTANKAMANLARALYRYGLSAEAYENRGKE